MTNWLPFVVSGIAVGSIYGLAASGLVLTYKTSGIFNFGHGAVATTGAYVFYWLHVDHSLAWPIAAAVAVLVVGPLLGVALSRFGALLAPQRIYLKIVGSVGLILLVQGLAVVKYGTNTVAVRQFLPGATASHRILGVVITGDRLVTIGIAVASVTALWVLFGRTRTGLMMRAVVDDPDLLAIHGTDPKRIRLVAWVIGCTFASLSGVLFLPLLGLDATLLTFLVVQAFAAAAVGGFTSIPLTFLGGLLVGVAADISKRYALDAAWLSGLPASIPFLVLVVVLVLRGRRLVAPSRIELRPAPAYRAPALVRLGSGGVLVAVLAFVPSLVGDRLPFFTMGLISAVMLLSLGLLVRMSGQVSLCHAAFAAIGAVAFSQLHVDHGWPWLLALLFAGLVTVPVGALVAIPAVRLSGLFLALATFGFGILVQRLLYSQSWMFTRFSQGRRMPRPGFADSGEDFYFVVLAVLVTAAVVIVVVDQSRLGRMLRGMAESPTGVAAMGLSLNTARVTVFCLSAFLAAIAGALLGVSRSFATGGDPFYGPFNSLVLLAMLALAPFGVPWFALAPAAAAVIPGYITGDDTVHWLNVLFGASAVFVAMTGGPPPMSARMRARLNHLRHRPPATVGAEDDELAVHVLPTGAGLEVVDLGIRYGGLQAAEDISLLAPVGRITGLIGPNGAGKTSVFNACSGFQARYSGSVLLHGRPVDRLGAAARARLGLGRSFQSIELCDALTVRENVELGDEASRAGANPARLLVASRFALLATRGAASRAMRLCGIELIAEVQAGALPTGQRRLVELARLLAGRFDVLLLDEPSAGLDKAETERFADVLRAAVRDSGVGILLVEHDMSLVLGVCEHVYVMDAGRLIFDGGPADVAADDTVRAAYLGLDEPSASSDLQAAR